MTPSADDLESRIKEIWHQRGEMGASASPFPLEKDVYIKERELRHATVSMIFNTWASRQASTVTPEKLVEGWKKIAESLR